KGMRGAAPRQRDGEQGEAEDREPDAAPLATGQPNTPEPPDKQRENADPAGRRGLHERERPNRERSHVEDPAADPDREPKQPAAVREEQQQRTDRPPHAEGGQPRRLLMLREV